MIQERSKPEQNFKLLHREIMMLKALTAGHLSSRNAFARLFG